MPNCMPWDSDTVIRNAFTFYEEKGVGQCLQLQRSVRDIGAFVDETMQRCQDMKDLMENSSISPTPLFWATAAVCFMRFATQHFNGGGNELTDADKRYAATLAIALETMREETLLKLDCANERKRRKCRDRWE